MHDTVHTDRHRCALQHWIRNSVPETDADVFSLTDLKTAQIPTRAANGTRKKNLVHMHMRFVFVVFLFCYDVSHRRRPSVVGL